MSGQYCQNCSHPNYMHNNTICRRCLTDAMIAGRLKGFPCV